MVWARTGLVPAASGGDEVWWSESGYWLAQEGSLKWKVMDDDRGSGTTSYWPPVLPIVQGFFIKVFGLSSFSIYAQSSLHCTILIILVYLMGRQRGLAINDSVYLGIGALGLFSVRKSFFQVRMESVTALASLAFIYLHSKAVCTGRKNFDYLAGMVLSIGIMAYYPLSPFLMASVLLVLIYEKNKESSKRIIIGLLPIAVISALWILSGWDKFYLQVLDTGTKHYFSFLSLKTSLIETSKTRNANEILKFLEVIVFGGLLIWQSSKFKTKKNNKNLILMGWCMFAPILFIKTPFILVAYLCAYVLFLGSSTGNTKEKTFLKNIRVCCALLAIIQILVICFTAVYQFSGRNYAEIKREIIKSLSENEGKIAISQRAWLALREKARPDQLHLLVYAGPSKLNASRVLKGTNAETMFEVLVLETDKIKRISEIYPWIGRVISNGSFHQVQRIQPKFSSLPWASNPCYDLTIFEKTKKQTK